MYQHLRTAQFSQDSYSMKDHLSQLVQESYIQLLSFRVLLCGDYLGRGPPENAKLWIVTADEASVEVQRRKQKRFRSSPFLSLVHVSHKISYCSFEAHSHIRSLANSRYHSDSHFLSTLRSFDRFLHTRYHTL